MYLKKIAVFLSPTFLNYYLLSNINFILRLYTKGANRHVTKYDYFRNAFCYADADELYTLVSHLICLKTLSLMANNEHENIVKSDL